MRKLLRVGEKGKTKLEPEERPMTSDLQIRVDLIQALIPYRVGGGRGSISPGGGAVGRSQIQPKRG